MIKVYAFKQNDGQVVVWADNTRSKRLAVFPADYSNKPTRRNKYVTINCVKYELVWI